MHKKTLERKPHGVLRHHKGFTLIELLVVIAIIGILATLVITQVAGAQVRARNAQAKSDITEAGKAIELFKLEPTNLLEQVMAASGTPRLWGATGTTGTTANGNFSGSRTIKTVFTGTTFYSGSTGTSRYGASLQKTPSSLHIYSYTAAGTAGVVNASSYTIWTTVSTGSGVDDTSFCVKNGTSINGTDSGYTGDDTNADRNTAGSYSLPC